MMKLFKRAVTQINAAADWLPRSQRLVAERRRHPRALLSLPVRLRWLGPLGLETESSETLDAARSGLLISSRELRAEGTLVWVTFPFGAGDSAAEPETPARVARAKAAPSGGYLAGIEFAGGDKLARRPGDSDLSLSADRRRHTRTRLALLIRIRGVDASWPDDVMTVDISHSGLLFCTLRIYERSENVALTLPRSTWLSAGDCRARIVRISSHLSEPRLQCVGVEFLS